MAIYGRLSLRCERSAFAALMFVMKRNGWAKKTQKEDAGEDTDALSRRQQTYMCRGEEGGDCIQPTPKEILGTATTEVPSRRKQNERWRKGGKMTQRRETRGPGRMSTRRNTHIDGATNRNRRNDQDILQRTNKQSKPLKPNERKSTRAHDSYLLHES